MTSRESRIGVVGLGNMGWEVASSLAEDGHAILVSDARADVEAAFVAEYSGCGPLGSRWADLDVLVLVLPDSSIVEAVIDNAAARLRSGTLVIDMSSSDPLSTRKLATSLAARRCRMVDAPVSGGVAGARERQLAILLGGAMDDVDEAVRLLAGIAKSLIHVGSIGSGHAAKALNNLVSAGGMSLTIEAIHAAEAFGIEPQRMLEVLNDSSGRTNTSENKVDRYMFSGRYDSGFALRLMAKDVAIATRLVDRLHLTGSVSACVGAQWGSTAIRVDGVADHTEMYRLIAAEQE